MARATLEMFLKLTGANKTSQGLDKVSKSTKELDKDVKNSTKANAQFSAGMSGLGKTAIAGGALFAAKSLADFSLAAIQAASSAQEAAGAFGTTFGGAAEKLNEQLAENANLFGLTSAEAQQLISVFGSVAQGIGFTQQESADLSSELFVLAGDIASFNNITAGAAPVLQAFRSALVGEREALKTYGIAITEAEVQTKAFEQTGKTSADELTRQEKALATTALLFERATVQIGNAKREEAGFAAQTLIARSATQELREELGKQLLPAAGEVLGVFNEIRSDATPALIETFQDLNLQILGLVEGFDRLRGLFRPDDYEEINKQLKEQFDLFPNGILGIKGLGRERLRQLEIEQKAIEVSDRTNDTIFRQQKQYNDVNDAIKQNRQQVLITTAQTQKYTMHLDKKLNPILGEQNRLIAENVELEIDRNKVLNLLSSANDNVEKAEKDRNKALKDVQELQIAENLADAKAVKRKSELQTEIGLLTKAEDAGKDVTNELAIAKAELAEAEFEIANESDALVRAREILEIAENNLTTAIDTQKTALDKRNDVLLESLDLTARQIIENGKLADSFAAIDTSALVGLGAVAPVTTAPATTEVPSLPVTDFTTTLVAGRQQTSTVDVNLNLTDAIGEIIQRENIKIQERGNTFVLEG